MKLVVLGLAVGALGGYALTHVMAREYFGTSTWRQMSDHLYRVKGTDPLTLFVIATVLTLVALLACWLPAGKAAQVDRRTCIRTNVLCYVHGHAATNRGIQWFMIQVGWLKRL